MASTETDIPQNQSSFPTRQTSSKAALPPYSPPSCPYRVVTSQDSPLASALSWCAHHAYNDRVCNTNAPCSAINTIAKDANFFIQSALLYIRSSDVLRRRVSSRLSLGDIDFKAATHAPNDAIDPKARGDIIVELQNDSPDLGLLHLHRDRLAAAADALGWRAIDCLAHNEAGLKLVSHEVEEHIMGLTPLPPSTLESRKVIIRINKEGCIFVTSRAIGMHVPDTNVGLLQQEWMPPSLDKPASTDIPPSKVYLDLQPTRPSTLTTHKTTHRCVYDSARERLDILPTIAPTAQEVILYNPFGEIIEASSSTVYFKRGGKWITPAAICGPTLGVTRRMAIEKGLCKQGTIEIKDLVAGEELWLSNGVRGFFRGVLVTEKDFLDASAKSEEIQVARLGAGTGGEVGYGRGFAGGVRSIGGK